MMQLNNILQVELCTGCTACKFVCSKEAISFLPNEEGFLYPRVNKELCINCGKCLKICQQKSNIKFNKCISSYIAISKLKEIYKKAASGGIFGTLAFAFLKEYKDKAYVCGASFESGKVRHILINDAENISKIQNSKYVQSELGNIYMQIKNKLEEGAYILFSGTPCQVQGLYSFLGYRPDRLLTLDLVCHGVPSPLFLKKDLQNYGLQKIKDISFRWKNVLFEKSTFFMTISCHEVWLRKIRSSNADPYFALFMRNMSFRESCYSCSYARMERVGDITIGDSHLSSEYPNFYPKLAKSCVLVNTALGNLYWSKFQRLFYFKEQNLLEEAKINTQLSKPSNRPNLRNQVYHDLNSMDFKKFRLKYGRFDSVLKETLLSLLDKIPLKI